MTAPGDDGAAEFRPVMPFVNVRSKGGIYDDDAYTAGWEMGALDHELAHAPAVFAGGRYLVHTMNTGQADLVAMRHGFVTEVLAETDGWTELLVTRTTRSDPP